jgi:hypothetical protein
MDIAMQHSRMASAAAVEKRYGGMTAPHPVGWNPIPAAGSGSMNTIMKVKKSQIGPFGSGISRHHLPEKGAPSRG